MPTFVKSSEHIEMFKTRLSRCCITILFLSYHVYFIIYIFAYFTILLVENKKTDDETNELFIAIHV